MVDKTPAPKLIEAVVLRGTVVHGGKHAVRDSDNPDPSLRMRILAEAEAPVHAGPGDTVLLPEAEVTRLRAAGFLVDPDRAAAPNGPGPIFSSDTGPTIRPA